MIRMVCSLLLVLGVLCHPALASDDDVTIRPLVDGVWLHTSGHTFDDGTHYTANGLIIRDGDHLVLIDSAWGDAKTAMLLDEIQSAIGLPVHMAVATHSHEDRAAGANVMKARGIRYYASATTRALIAERGGAAPEYMLDLPAEAGATVKFGPAEILYPGTAHTADNLIVWFGAQNLLFGGCAVREASSQSLGYFKEGDPATWGGAMRLAKAAYSDAQIVVPGHGEVGDISLLDHTAALAAAHMAQVSSEKP
ncbi:MAG: subclass B1 metallo-beta-lactamase [Alphaproteobacteria bacterium]|nr:subclass B1 metallo-beta-lactamase [Alphaproteobacteria bacterium]